MNDRQDLILEGQDIYLRPMTDEDAERIILWRNQDFVRKNFIFQKPFTRSGHARWVKSMIESGKGVQYIIVTQKGDFPIGSVYLRDIDRQNSKAEYGIFIGEEAALGCGFGTQAARLMLTYAFETLHLHKIMLRLLAGNDRARKSYENAGFVQEAYLQDELVLDGHYQDIIYMAALNEKQCREEKQ